LLIDAEANLGMVYVKRDSARAGEIITADKRSSSHRLPYAPLERAFLHFLDSLDWQSLLELPESKEEAELSKVGLERSEAERVLLKLEGFLDPDSKEPVPERFLAKMSEAEAALKTVLAREVSLSREVSATRSLMTRPEELRAEIEAGDIPLRFRVREEIRRRVSKISLTFRCRSLVVATIDFVNGARRLIGLWKSEPGDAEKAGLSKVPGVRPVPPDMLKEFAAELKGTPLEKGIVYFYSPYPPRERALKGAKRKAARS
jgi:hypothetical protein